MIQPIITIATPSDAKDVRQVQHDTWIATYPNESLGITVDAIKKRIAAYITTEKIEALKKSLIDPQQRTWIATINSATIGYCTASTAEDNNRLEALYVLPAYQGMHVGKALIEPALTWMGETKPIELEAASYNQQALSFYKKYGFKLTNWIGDNAGIPTVFLIKQ